MSASTAISRSSLPPSDVDLSGSNSNSNSSNYPSLSSPSNLTSQVPISTTRREITSDRTVRYASPLVKFNNDSTTNINTNTSTTPTDDTNNTNKYNNDISGSCTPTQSTQYSSIPALTQSSSALSQQLTEIDAEDAHSLLLLRDDVTPPSSMPNHGGLKVEELLTETIVETPRVQTPNLDVVMESPVLLAGSPIVGSKRTSSGVVKTSSVSSSPQILGDRGPSGVNIDRSRITEVRPTRVQRCGVKWTIDDLYNNL